MTLKGLIEYINQVKPNAFTPEVKTVWVNEIEGMIQEQIMLLSPADIITYDYAEDAETELLVPPPHTKLYYAYLQAMIDFAVGEYQNYANTMELFNRWWNEYAAWYALRIDPASGNAKFRGYYLSAYAIAVKHGYTGTEEEWAQVLIDAAENARRAEVAAGSATAASDTAQAAAASADADSKAASDAAGVAQSAAGTAAAAAGSAQTSAASATEAQNAALLSAEEAQTAANRAETALTRAPRIIDGVWFVWDATKSEYVSTGVKAESEECGLTTAQLNALDGMFKIASYTADPTTAYSMFKVAFGIESSGEVEPENPDVTLTSISAKYSGGDVEVGTAVTELTGIVVTATYSDGSTATVTDYTLSGTIAEGVNIITVFYGGLIATFTVTGVDDSVVVEYSVTNNLTNVTNSNTQTTITDGYYSATLTVDEGYSLESINITMGGVDVTADVYTSETGSILITEVTGNIVVTAAAIELQYISMRTHLFHDVLNLYSSADTTTTLRTINYVSGGALSLCRTETDVNVTVRLTNNTDSDVTDSSYAGCVKSYLGNTSRTYVYNAILGTSATVRSGQSIEYTYTLKAGYYLYVFANNSLEVSVVGALDIHEPVAEYELTTGYADAWNAYGGGTTDDKIAGGYYVTFTTTTEVFEEDTELRITLLNGGTTVNYIGSAKQDAPTTLFYAVSGLSVPESGGMSVGYYTVKAGHILSMGFNNLGYIYVEKA